MTDRPMTRHPASPDRSVGHASSWVLPCATCTGFVHLTLPARPDRLSVWRHYPGYARTERWR